MIRTSVQAEAFDAAAELAALGGDGDAGALVSFTGLVRGEPGSTLELQHYPGMTERQLDAIAGEAAERFAVLRGRVIHRYGLLHPGDAIVFVAVASPHRGDAFDAARFLMDWLKTKAPFWKRETRPDGTAHWVEAQAADNEAAALWD
ncbi:MAG: molybdenum cofactor biosynthesis protein MoaE [Pacificimonas sp.]|jgi:molybdopterin synthase catalytic subunit|nr:molybdenum cofactor biosynthesis protein MoaE [Pacificimonas sp.]